MKTFLKYAFLFICVTLMTVSCRKPQLGSDTPTGTTVRLVPNFLGLYEDFYQPNKSMRIEIIVDNLDANMNPVSNFSTRFETRSNVGTTSNYTFNDVQVPDAGSYAISAVVCGASCYTGSQECSEFDTGKPFFKKVETLGNQTSAPSSITIEPEFVTCQ